MILSLCSCLRFRTLSTIQDWTCTTYMPPVPVESPTEPGNKTQHEIWAIARVFSHSFVTDTALIKVSWWSEIWGTCLSIIGGLGCGSRCACFHISVGHVMINRQTSFYFICRKYKDWHLFTVLSVLIHRALIPLLLRSIWTMYTPELLCTSVTRPRTGSSAGNRAVCLQPQEQYSKNTYEYHLCITFPWRCGISMATAVQAWEGVRWFF